MSSDEVAVATNGVLPREDRCKVCSGPMLYRVKKNRDQGTDEIYMFCGSVDCETWLQGVMCSQEESGPASSRL